MPAFDQSHPLLTRCKQVLLCAVVCLTLFSTPTLADTKADQSKQTLSAIKKKIKALKEAIGSTEVKHKDAIEALKNSEVAISKSNKKLYEINQKNKKHRKKLSLLKSDVTKINAQLSQQQKHLSNQLYSQYTQGKQSTLQLLLQQDHPLKAERSVQYYAYIAKARRDAILQMQNSLSLLQTLNVETSTILKKIASLKKSQIAEKRELEKQQLERQVALELLAKKIASQHDEIKKLKQDEKSLSSLIKKLARIAKEKAKQKKKKKSTNTTIAKNTIEPTNEFAGRAFASLKGKLRLPVKGSILNHFGKHRKDTGVLWKGLFIKAKEGAKVKCVANGEVVFANWMRGFGNLIIVDHGGSYLSLYGNNQAVLKSVGNKVKAGDVIATVGNTGGNKQNGLYYELRKKTKPVDPLKWSKLK